jgi:hypothetical protein
MSAAAPARADPGAGLTRFTDLTGFFGGAGFARFFETLATFLTAVLRFLDDVFIATLPMG